MHARARTCISYPKNQITNNLEEKKKVNLVAKTPLKYKNKYTLNKLTGWVVKRILVQLYPLDFINEINYDINCPRYV